MQATRLANRTDRPTDWNSVNWRVANRRVRNLRQRIFRATQAGDWDKVQSLQRLMLRSYSNTLLSVRRVTQVNQGKKTAGVDKVIVKTPETRGRLVDLLMTNQPWKAKPAKRVYIPKASGKLRPLGIPTILDRCLQARVKNALEPSWEARFEGINYGFRPGRGCHDAIGKVYLLARPNKTRKWVVDADIKGAFDHIDHDYLLRTIGSAPGRELIKQWLKAGYVSKNVFHRTDEGTPQGGVISPLLANIALHGMEEALGVTYRSTGEISHGPAVVRYADDFVVFCHSKEEAEEVIQKLKGWLAIRGLTLAEEKTRIVHLTEGFDFLSYNVRHYKDNTRSTECKLLIKPSKDAVKSVRAKLRDEWRRLQGSNHKAVITNLNPIIRGWANYHRVNVASRTFQSLDNWMFRKEQQFVRRMHPTKPWKWRRAKYWGKLNPERDGQWVFGDKRSGMRLLKFQWFKIERHALVKGNASPDDPHLKDYWKGRQAAQAKDLIPSQQRIAKQQQHVCLVCGESLFNNEETEAHHIEPRVTGGKDNYGNLTLMHLYCHQQVTSEIRAREPKRKWLRQWLA